MLLAASLGQLERMRAAAAAAKGFALDRVANQLPLLRLSTGLSWDEPLVRTAEAGKGAESVFQVTSVPSGDASCRGHPQWQGHGGGRDSALPQRGAAPRQGLQGLHRAARRGPLRLGQHHAPHSGRAGRATARRTPTLHALRTPLHALRARRSAAQGAAEQKDAKAEELTLDSADSRWRCRCLAAPLIRKGWETRGFLCAAALRPSCSPRPPAAPTWWTCSSRRARQSPNAIAADARACTSAAVSARHCRRHCVRPGHATQVTARARSLSMRAAVVWRLRAHWWPRARRHLRRT